MSLFVLASKDGWVNLMYTGLDAVGVDEQVIYDQMRLRINQHVNVCVDVCSINNSINNNINH